MLRLIDAEGAEFIVSKFVHCIWPICLCHWGVLWVRGRGPGTGRLLYCRDAPIQLLQFWHFWFVYLLIPTDTRTLSLSVEDHMLSFSSPHLSNSKSERFWGVKKNHDLDMCAQCTNHMPGQDVVNLFFNWTPNDFENSFFQNRISVGPWCRLRLWIYVWLHHFIHTCFCHMLKTCLYMVRFYKLQHLL